MLHIYKIRVYQNISITIYYKSTNNCTICTNQNTQQQTGVMYDSILLSPNLLAQYRLSHHRRRSINTEFYLYIYILCYVMRISDSVYLSVWFYYDHEYLFLFLAIYVVFFFFSSVFLHLDE